MFANVNSEYESSRDAVKMLEDVAAIRRKWEIITIQRKREAMVMILGRLSSSSLNIHKFIRELSSVFLMKHKVC